MAALLRRLAFVAAVGLTAGVILYGALLWALVQLERFA